MQGRGSLSRGVSVQGCNIKHQSWLQWGIYIGTFWTHSPVPLGVEIFSIPCSFWQNRMLEGWHLHLGEILDPPLDKPTHRSNSTLRLARQTKVTLDRELIITTATVVTGM